jgi:hypothetical protein
MLQNIDQSIAEKHLATLKSGGYYFLASQFYYGIYGTKYLQSEVGDLKRLLNQIMIPDLWDARDYFLGIVDLMILIDENGNN